MHSVSLVTAADAVQHLRGQRDRLVMFCNCMHAQDCRPWLAACEFISALFVEEARGAHSHAMLIYSAAACIHTAVACSELLAVLNLWR